MTGDWLFIVGVTIVFWMLFTCAMVLPLDEHRQMEELPGAAMASAMAVLGAIAILVVGIRIHDWIWP